MNNVYKQLALHLDKTPGGFPETETGVELRILKQLFTQAEAQLALSLILMPEPAESIAQRTGKPVEEIKPMLIEMGNKGLLIHMHKDSEDTFMLAQFVVGIWEFQVNRLTKELIQDFNEYVPFLTDGLLKTKTKQLRVVPVSKAINTELNVMDYEQLESIIRSQSKILVLPCICRKEHNMIGKGCDKLSEACLAFGSGAYIYENRGVGRSITQEEALEIVQEGIKQGLVPQPSNAQKASSICLCCDCCCQILKNLKKFEAPAKFISSNFQAQVNQEECTGCESCEEICPMDAIAMDSDDGNTATVNLDRCIGCGLCVTVCEFDAVSLKDKEISERLTPPPNIVDMYTQIAQEKGLF
jgi:Na+-translocating ferredoxin:NAD+ oxidoreductase subunit B